MEMMTTPPSIKEATETLGHGFLLDGWEREGRKPSEFFKTLESLESVLRLDKVFMRDIILCSPNSFEGEDSIVFKAFAEPKPIGRRMRREKMEQINAPLLFNELITQKGCLLWLGGANPTRLCRPKALRELMNNLGLSGPAIENQSPKRDEYVAELIASAPGKQQITLICRREGDDENYQEKVLAIRTARYAHIPMTELEKVYRDIVECSDIGKVECSGWHIDHDIATIDLWFPDVSEEFKELNGFKDALKAGVRLTTSGTGYSCFMATELWDVNGVVSEHACVKNKHIGEWDADKFFDNVKTNIFDEYSTMPERLCELFDIEVLNNDIICDSGKLKLAENILFSSVKSVFKKLQLAKAFKSKTDEDSDSGKGYVNKLTEKLVDILMIPVQKAISEGENFAVTAYDIAIAVMELPSRVSGIPKSYMKAFTDKCGKAPYCDYKAGKEYVKKPDISIVA